MNLTDKEIENIAIASQEITNEVVRAKGLFPGDFNSQHEAIAVIREEYLELEQEIFKNQKVYDLTAQRKEACQLAAMCIRLMSELLTNE